MSHLHRPSFLGPPATEEHGLLGRGGASAGGLGARHQAPVMFVCPVLLPLGRMWTVSPLPSHAAPTLRTAPHLWASAS